MINNYSLFYSYKRLGDVLLVRIDEEAKPDKTITNKNVSILSKEDRVISYHIFNISKIMKIKTSGIIFLPSTMFIDVINDILKNANQDILSYKDSSGYVTGKVKKVTPLNEGCIIEVDTINDMLTCYSPDVLKENDVVCIAKIGTSLNNGKVIKSKNKYGHIINGYVCSEKDVGVSESDTVLLLENDSLIGVDFFQMEEKINVRN